ncbi:MAG: hypothetical protein ACREHD_00505 [Pirellulales bacterium]
MLDDAQELLNQDWTGHCYEAATKYAGAVKDEDLLVVHGSICANGRRIRHAWCESGDNVVDLASPDRKIFAQSEYYQLFAPDVRQRLSVKDALLFSFAHGYVAWEESVPFRPDLVAELNSLADDHEDGEI